MTHRKSGSTLVTTAGDSDLLPFWERQFRRLPIVDRETGSISITRTIVFMFAIEIVVIMARTLAVAPTVLAMSIAVLAASFGKSTFGYFLTKQQMTNSISASATAAVSVSETITKAITERRNPDSGIEPT